MLGLLVSPLTRWLAGLGVVLLVVGGAYIKGRVDCGSNAQVANLRAENAILAARLKTLADITDADARRASEDSREIERLKGLVNATPENSAACMPADAARRVRELK